MNVCAYVFHLFLANKKDIKKKQNERDTDRKIKLFFLSMRQFQNAHEQ